MSRLGLARFRDHLHTVEHCEAFCTYKLLVSARRSPHSMRPYGRVGFTVRGVLRHVLWNLIAVMVMLHFIPVVNIVGTSALHVSSRFRTQKHAKQKKLPQGAGFHCQFVLVLGHAALTHLGSKSLKQPGPRDRIDLQRQPTSHRDALQGILLSALTKMYSTLQNYSCRFDI